MIGYINKTRKHIEYSSKQYLLCSYPSVYDTACICLLFIGKTSKSINCQARVQVPNPLSQQDPNPDSEGETKSKKPKNPILWTGLTQ